MYKNQSVKTEELEMCSDLMFDKVKIDFSKHAECDRENWWALYSKTWKKEKNWNLNIWKIILEIKRKAKRKQNIKSA